MMITSIDKVDRQDDFYPSSFREEIIKDLNETLNTLAPCFIQDDYTYEDRSLPVIIISDGNDDITLKGEALSHELNVSIDLIDKKIDAKLIKEALLKLSKFKSSFANCTLVSISREFEAGERNVIRTRVELKFLYFTNLWSY
jgi:hypothetical protein|nr:MAG TPA: hypothetical protein [Caudoviricetes sp.]